MYNQWYLHWKFIFIQTNRCTLFVLLTSLESWWFIKNTLNHVHLISNAKFQCLTHWSFLFSNHSPLSRCLFNYLDKIYMNHFNQLKYHLSPSNLWFLPFDFLRFSLSLSIHSNHNHKFNFYSPRSYFSWLFILRPTQYPTTYLRERLPLSDWYFSGRGARAASGNDRPRTGDPCSCLAVHLDRTDFASGSTVHVDEFTCAFRHRRIRQSWREREREGLV